MQITWLYKVTQSWVYGPINDWFHIDKKIWQLFDINVTYHIKKYIQEGRWGHHPSRHYFLAYYICIRGVIQSHFYPNNTYISRLKQWEICFIALLMWHASRVSHVTVGLPTIKAKLIVVWTSMKTLPSYNQIPIYNVWTLIPSVIANDSKWYLHAPLNP